MKKMSKLLLMGSLLCSIGVFLTSCEKEKFEEETSVQLNANEGYELVEIELNGKMVTVQKVGKQYLIDDILFRVEPNTESNKLTGKTGDRWPNNTVYYAIESGLSNQGRITNAIAHWEARTSLTFIERSNQSDYIYFREASGVCNSLVGRQGGSQDINLDPACPEGTVIHEIGHAIGLWHEQSRADRDEYIIFYEENVDDDRLHNFQTYDERGLDGEEYTSELDFNSIMLYDSYAFSNNDKPTLTKLNGDTWVAQRDGLSVYDVRGIDQMYPTNNPTKINIRGSNGKYVSSENGEEPMICDRDTPRGWEEFLLVARSNGRVALRGNNDKFVSSENGLKPISCDRPSINSWEEFELVMYPGNQFALKSTSSNKFISSENGEEPMTCDRDTPNRWEIFTMSRAD